MNRQKLNRAVARLVSLSVVTSGIVLSVATSPPAGPNLAARTDGPIVSFEEPMQSATLEVVVRANAAAVSYAGTLEAFELSVAAEQTQETLAASEADPPAGEGGDAAAPFEDDSRAVLIDIANERGDQLDAARDELGDDVVYVSTSVDLREACELDADCELHFFVTLAAPTEAFDAFDLATDANVYLGYVWEEGQDALPVEAAVEVELLEVAPAADAS